MLPDKRNTSSGSTADNQFDAARVFCEMIPGAVALWSRDRSFCLLNESAQRLINFSPADFVHRPSLWVERIHPDDREKFCRTIKESGKGKLLTRCDYRFFPGGADRPLWIREHSMLGQDQSVNAWEIISTYTDISDLKSTHGAKTEKDDVSEIARLLIHEVHNRIQKITMELELTEIDPRRQLNFTEVVDSTKHSLQELQDQVAKILERWTPQDLLTIVDGIMRKMRKELKRQNVNLRLVRGEPLPIVEGDEAHLRSAFEQVFEFCGSMLKHGGNLEVEAQRKEVSGQVYAEVKLTSSSSSSIEVDQKQEIIQAEGHRIGLGIMLATEILRRYRGQVSFHRESINRGQVTVLIKASPR